MDWLDERVTRETILFGVILGGCLTDHLFEPFSITKFRRLIRYGKTVYKITLI